MVSSIKLLIEGKGYIEDPSKIYKYISEHQKLSELENALVAKGVKIDSKEPRSIELMIKGKGAIKDNKTIYEYYLFRDRKLSKLEESFAKKDLHNIEKMPFTRKSDVMVDIPKPKESITNGGSDDLNIVRRLDANDIVRFITSLPNFKHKMSDVQLHFLQRTVSTRETPLYNNLYSKTDRARQLIKTEHNGVWEKTSVLTNDHTHVTSYNFKKMGRH